MLMVAIRLGRYFTREVGSVGEAEELEDSDYCVVIGVYVDGRLWHGKGIDHSIAILNEHIEKGSQPEPEWIYVKYGRYMPKDEYKEYRPWLGLRKEQLAQLLKIKADNNL